MATTTSVSLKKITNFCAVLLELQPNSEQLANAALRVDNGNTTLAKILFDLYNSPSCQVGHANEWAEAFFVLTGRAPDYATFMQGMNLLRLGTSFAGLMDTVLTIPGLQLSNNGIPNNLDFVNKMYFLLTGGGGLATATSVYFAGLIDNGTYTRGSLLAALLEHSNPLFHGGRDAQVQKSLIFLAAADDEAAALDLASARGSLSADIQAALDSAGLGTPSGYSYWSRPGSGSAMQLKGELTADLSVNLQTDIYTLGGKSPVKVYYSVDGGIDASLTNLSILHTTGLTTIDASQATGKGKLLLTAENAGGVSFIAPAAGSTLRGGDGSDTLTGNAGVDKLFATAGTDTLTGGAGVDTFVMAPAVDYRYGGAYTAITDFGNGVDVLDVSKLLGVSGATTTKLTPILATSIAATNLANGGVALVENNGVWIAGGVPRPASTTQIAGLFGAGKVFADPLATGRYVVITADLTNGADIWLINNDTLVTSIDTSEIKLVGHIDGDWNVTLNGMMPIIR